MGEHADDALDRMCEDDWYPGGARSYGRDYPTSIRCKRCGGGPLDWKQFGWEQTRDGLRPILRLVEDDDEETLHVCPPPKPEDLFEVLP